MGERMIIAASITSISQTIATSSLQIAGDRFVSSWPWYIIRASGFLSAGLLILLMLSGIGQVTGLTYRFLEPIKAWALHKAMALALVAGIIVHVSFLLFDKFLPFSISQVLVPFLSHYSNNIPLLGVAIGTIAVGLGVLAMYGVFIIVASSLGWIDSKKKVWKSMHYISYAVMLFVFVHALGTGSDLKYGTFRAAWMLAGLILSVGIITRLWRFGTLKRHTDK